MKRPFWMHQLVEYVIGVLLVSQGLQSAEPAVPTVIGAAVLVNAATAKGQLGAFQKVPRSVHRIIDVVLLAATVVAACLPESIVDNSARVILIGVAAVVAYVIWKTDYREKPRRTRRAATPPAPAPPAEASPGPVATEPGPRPRGTGIDSEELGRAAGRTAGKLYNAARRRKRS